MVRLRSPRVVMVLGVVTTSPAYLGLVMEYLPGGSLRCALSRDGPISETVRRTWSADVAFGMAYLYSQRVEHRDLKSLNVLLTARDGRAKVADFGISRCPELATTQSPRAGLKGTTAFMAPELLEHQTFTEKSDVYSFAIVLHEIWSRRTAWDGLAPATIISQVVFKRARPPLPDAMPRDMIGLMRRCWADDAESRPTFAEIAADFRAAATPPNWAPPEARLPPSGQNTTQSLPPDDAIDDAPQPPKTLPPPPPA